MLEFDRLASGRVELKLKPLDLNACVRDSVVRAEVSGIKCSINTSLDPALPTVVADSDRMLQVISNLLSNAIKYSPDGGEILIATSLHGDHVNLSVKDHGHGIAPEDQARLFERFGRFGNTEHKISGTGLGMAITRQIIELHGGRIWVQS